MARDDRERRTGDAGSDIEGAGHGDRWHGRPDVGPRTPEGWDEASKWEREEQERREQRHHEGGDPGVARQLPDNHDTEGEGQRGHRREQAKGYEHGLTHGGSEQTAEAWRQARAGASEGDPLPGNTDTLPRDTDRRKR